MKASNQIKKQSIETLDKLTEVTAKFSSLTTQVYQRLEAILDNAKRYPIEAAETIAARTEKCISQCEASAEKAVKNCTTVSQILRSINFKRNYYTFITAILTGATCFLALIIVGYKLGQ